MEGQSRGNGDQQGEQLEHSKQCDLWWTRAYLLFASGQPDGLDRKPPPQSLTFSVNTAVSCITPSLTFDFGSKCFRRGHYEACHHACFQRSAKVCSHIEVDPFHRAHCIPLCIRSEGSADQSWLYAYDTQNVIREFQRQANALLPVAKLPPEILIHVFDFCLIEPQAIYDLGLQRVCLAFSQVCDHWRRVALADRRLWTSFVLYDPSQSQIMLTRARGLPLHVTLGVEDDPHVDVWSAELAPVLTHPDLHQLSILAHSSCKGIKKLVGMIKEPLPQLRCLEILTAVPTRLQSPGLEGPGASTLERLCLTSCILPWDAPCLSNLVRLNIRCPQTSLVPRSDLRHILETLGNMLSLRFLQLSRATSVGDNRLTTKTSLGCLQDLCLYDEGECIAAFLGNINIPSMA